MGLPAIKPNYRVTVAKYGEHRVEKKQETQRMHASGMLSRTASFPLRGDSWADVRVLIGEHPELTQTHLEVLEDLVIIIFYSDRLGSITFV